MAEREIGLEGGQLDARRVALKIHRRMCSVMIRCSDGANTFRRPVWSVGRARWCYLTIASVIAFQC